MPRRGSRLAEGGRRQGAPHARGGGGGAGGQPIRVLAGGEVWMILVPLDQSAPDQWGFRGFEAALALSFGSVGALIAARRPENRVGWLLLGGGAVAGGQGVVGP